MVVDDEASVREMTRATLEAYKYRVITAGDGAEATALYLQNSGEIEVVIMAMMMPVMDGPMTIRKLRRIAPQVKIIAVSGLMEGEKLAEVKGNEVQAFLSKPYRAETLLKNLHKVLSMKKTD